MSCILGCEQSHPPSPQHRHPRFQKRALRAKGVAKRPRLKAMKGRVDAVGFEPTAAWLQTKRSSS